MPSRGNSSVWLPSTPAGSTLLLAYIAQFPVVIDSHG
jgi:hypothetical protein